MPRSIADQTVAELGRPTSVLVRQRNDHEQLNRLLRELDGTTGRDQERVLRRIDRLAPAGEAVSRGLATVAGWVERLPPARRGDGPPTSR